ncbi:hypothetical protein ACWEGX_26935 [Streptomyces chartreusis]
MSCRKAVDPLITVTDGGIYTPATATGLEAADTPTVDVTVTGTGAVGDPY